MKAKRRILFRADGNTEIGMGHIYRCMAQAELLQSEYTCSLLTQRLPKFLAQNLTDLFTYIHILPEDLGYNEEAKYIKPLLVTGDEIIVLDGYSFDTAYQGEIKSLKVKLVCVDDVQAFPYLADVVINHAFGDYTERLKVESYTKLYTGVKYLLLRKEFLLCAEKVREFTECSRVFLAMGGGDTLDYLIKVIKACCEIGKIQKLEVLVGNDKLIELKKFVAQLEKGRTPEIKLHYEVGAQELTEILEKCHYAVTPASNISMEVSCIGMGVAIGQTASNQEAIRKGLVQENAATYIGEFEKLSIQDIKEHIAANFNVERIKEMNKNQKRVFDGKSGDRLLDLFRSL